MQSKEVISKKIYLLFVIIIIIIGVLLRIIGWNPNYGFDQVQIIENAARIRHGDFTLIGPRTGPASMFTGPLIYYITAFFLFFIEEPFALVGTIFVISTATLVVLCILSNIYLSKKETLFILALYSLSPYFIKMDRIGWNPQLLILVGSLVFFPLLKMISKGKTDNKDLFFIFLGSLLAFQAHFSGFIIPLLVFLSTILFSIQKKRTLLFLTLLGFVISFIPMIVFDLRNDWLNAKGLLNLLTNETQVKLTFGIFFTELYSNLIKTFTNLGSIFIDLSSRSLASVIGGYTLLLFLLHKNIRNKDKKTFKFILLWIFLFVFLYAFYREGKPTYYFFIQIPAFLYLSSRLILEFLDKKKMIFISILGFSFYSGYFLYKNYYFTSTINHQEMYLLKKKAASIEKHEGIKNIFYDMKNTDAYGFKSILRDVNISGEGKLVHVIFPCKRNVLTTYRYNNICLWIDERDHENRQYLYDDGVIIESNKKINLYIDNNYNNFIESDQAFGVVHDNQSFLGKMILINRNNNIEEFNKIYQVVKGHENEWVKVSIYSKPGYAKYIHREIMFFFPNSEIFDIINHQDMQTLTIFDSIRRKPQKNNSD